MLFSPVILGPVLAIAPADVAGAHQELYVTLHDQRLAYSGQGGGGDSNRTIPSTSFAVDTLPPGLQLAQELLWQEDIQWSVEQIHGCDGNGDDINQSRYQSIFLLGGQKIFVRIITEGESPISLELLDIQRQQESGLPLRYDPEDLFGGVKIEHIKFWDKYESVSGRGYGLVPELPVNQLILL